jgi:hypothetical protein
MSDQEEEEEAEEDNGQPVRDAGPELIQTVVADALAIQRWAEERMTKGDGGASPLAVADGSFDFWLPVARADAVAQALAVVDRSWRLAVTLVEAAEHGSSAGWPLDDLFKDPRDAALVITNIAPGSLAASLRATAKNAQTQVLPKVLTAGALIAIPGGAAATVDVILPDHPPARCPIAAHMPSPATQHELVVNVGAQPPGMSTTATVVLRDGTKVVLEVRSLRAPKPKPSQGRRRGTAAG